MFPKSSPKFWETIRNLSQMVSKQFLNMSRKNAKKVPVMPGIEPGTTRTRLRDRSEDQPIGLISSQKRGSLEISYVSKLETRGYVFSFLFFGRKRAPGFFHQKIRHVFPKCSSAATDNRSYQSGNFQGISRPVEGQNGFADFSIGKIPLMQFFPLPVGKFPANFPTGRGSMDPFPVGNFPGTFPTGNENNV